MQRIPRVNSDAAPAEVKAVLDNIRAKFGRLPNIFATVANSPVALQMLMAMFGALDKGALAGKSHEAIALRIGEIHGCRYCTAAHTAKAKAVGWSEPEILDLRRGKAKDAKLQALLALAGSIALNRGKVSDSDLQAARSAGASDGEILETLAIVVLNIFTNYINAVAQTEVDFPAAPELK
ncbi:MAG: carboxymuconolactone decarboxylase family protein [Planctomycetota bacterium]|nr:carboxymuconolactone decarboxylase family protein [Planctomycetota bacterium]